MEFGAQLGRPIYLDHNATTPLDPDVFAEMVPYFLEKFGNPSSTEHFHGNEAQTAVEQARERVAHAIGARSQEIIFTGSCTEANNLAILGLARAHPNKRHIVTSQIEHLAILETLKTLESDGYEVTYVRVDEFGRVDPGDVFKALREDTLVVSIMAGNNEVGTLQPLREIGERCAARGVFFHSDLAQTVAYLRHDVQDENLHLASLSAHKAYGPKGVGALYIRSRGPRVRIKPLTFGGGQERGLRSGTLNTPLIVGMGAALALAVGKRSATAKRLRSLCENARTKIVEGIQGAVLNGHATERLPSNLSFSIDGVEPLALIRLLRQSVSFSASSACTTQEVRTSHVTLAMFGNTWRARHAFRIAPGRNTTDSEMSRASELLIEGVKRLRASL